MARAVKAPAPPLELRPCQEVVCLADMLGPSLSAHYLMLKTDLKCDTGPVFCISRSECQRCSWIQGISGSVESIAVRRVCQVNMSDLQHSFDLRG